MLNYYALSPTSYDYVESLGVSRSLTSVINAATPITETIIAFMYNHLTNTRYKLCYYISITCLTLSNLSYASAASANSILLLILGRILLGAGGARIVTRKFVALMVAVHARTKYSAIFVTFTALGKTMGPGMSSVFQTVPEFQIGPWDWEKYNSYSFIAFIIWLLFGIFVFICFEDIQQQIQRQLTKIKIKSVMFVDAFRQLSHLPIEEIKKLTAMKKNMHMSVTEKFKQSGINFKMSMINLETIQNAENNYLPKPSFKNNDFIQDSAKMENKEKAANKVDYEWRNSLIKYEPTIKEPLKANSSMKMP